MVTRVLKTNYEKTNLSLVASEFSVQLAKHVLWNFQLWSAEASSHYYLRLEFLRGVNRRCSKARWDFSQAFVPHGSKKGCPVKTTGVTLSSSIHSQPDHTISLERSPSIHTMLPSQEDLGPVTRKEAKQCFKGCSAAGYLNRHCTGEVQLHPQGFPHICFVPLPSHRHPSLPFTLNSSPTGNAVFLQTNSAFT